VRTGRDLDVAVDGEGWIAVQAPDGGEAYTRRGDLRLGPGGILVNGAGHPVLGGGGPVSVPPFETLVIGADGTVTIRPEQSNVSVVDVLTRMIDLARRFELQVRLMQAARENDQASGQLLRLG